MSAADLYSDRVLLSRPGADPPHPLRGIFFFRVYGGG